MSAANNLRNYQNAVSGFSGGVNVDQQVYSSWRQHNDTIQDQYKDDVAAWTLEKNTEMTKDILEGIATHQTGEVIRNLPKTWDSIKDHLKKGKGKYDQFNKKYKEFKKKYKVGDPDSDLNDDVKKKLVKEVVVMKVPTFLIFLMFLLVI